MARKLVLIRHGEVEERLQGRLVGSTDAALSAAGLAQARGLAALVSSKNPDVIFSSPMKRCLDTAREACGCAEVIAEPLLREVDFGAWEGLTFNEVMTSHPADAAKWAVCDTSLVYPGGDALADFIARVDEAADVLRSGHSGTVAAFTHGGVIRFMLCRLLGLELSKHSVFEIGYADAYVLKLYDGGAVLSEVVKPPRAADAAR